MQKILIIVGMPGSGKTTAAKFISKKFNAYFISTGDVIREEIKRRGWKYTPETDAKMRAWFHRGRTHLITKKIWKKIKNKKFVVIDGFRSYKEYKLIKRLSKSKPVIISIKASFEERAKREKARKRFAGYETYKYLKDRDRSELKFGLKTIIKKADYSIDNTKLSKIQTQKKLVALMNIINKKDFKS